MKESANTVKQRVGTITGLDYWTTGLEYRTHPNCKIHLIQCRTEVKRTYSLNNTAPYRIYPGVSEVKGHIHIYLWWLCLNPVEFKQALSTHELYQQEGNTYLLESTFTKLSIENLVPERIRRALYRNQSLAFVESRLCWSVDSRRSIPLSCIPACG